MLVAIEDQVLFFSRIACCRHAGSIVAIHTAVTAMPMSRQPSRNLGRGLGENLLNPCEP